jgi:hypothetical protein
MSLQTDEKSMCFVALARLAATYFYVRLRSSIFARLASGVF